MPSTTDMHIDVHKRRHIVGVERVQEGNIEPSFFASLTQRSGPRRLPRIDVSTWLQPEAEPLVLQQDHPARPDHQRRAGDVNRIRFLRQRVAELVERLDEPFNRHLFTFIDGDTRHHIGPQSSKHIERHTPHCWPSGGPIQIILMQFFVNFFLSSRQFEPIPQGKPEQTGQPLAWLEQNTALQPGRWTTPGGKMIMDQEINLSPRILIAVSDPDLRRVAVAGLRSSGFCVSAPTDAEAAMLLAQSFSPDVLIVDSRLVTPEGRPLFEQLRNSTEQYLMCIAGEGEHRVRSVVLQSGADDAISTPLHVDELAARCNAMLRRPRQLQQRVESVSAASLIFGPLTIDLGRHEVRVDNEEALTTRIEFSLLEQLCRRPTEVCTRDELLDAVWGPRWVGDSHVVDVHLSNLRRKLDQAAPGTKVIHTVRGVGFRLANDITDAIGIPLAVGVG